MHEQGLADDELVEDHEREHFAGTSAVRDDHHDDNPSNDDPRDDDTYVDRSDDGRHDTVRERADDLSTRDAPPRGARRL